MKILPWLMFWVLGLLWGTSFIYMKMASLLIAPLQIVLIRLICALVPIALYAHYQGALRRDHLRYAVHFVVMAMVGTVGYYYGFTKGVSLLPSGVAGALSGLTPIMSFALALALLDRERATRVKALGIAFGFLGVVLIARPFDGDIGAANIEGVLYTLLGSASVGASFVYAKKYILPLGIPIAALITYQLGLSLIVLFLVTDLEGIDRIWSDPFVALCLVLGLGVLGTGLAYISYYYIIDTLGAVAASSVAYIPPVIAIAIGVFLAGEHIEPIEYLGAALIFAGVVLVNTRPATAE